MYGPRPRDMLSRKEEREDGRRGVVGRERGDLERVRRNGGSAEGVVDMMLGFFCLFCGYVLSKVEGDCVGLGIWL